MTITGSIYMVVVISVERYRLEYSNIVLPIPRDFLSRAFLHPFEKHFNWLHLVLFTVSLSVTVNITKFLEFEVNLDR